MISCLILFLMFERTSQETTPVLKGIFVWCQTCPGCFAKKYLMWHLTELEWSGFFFSCGSSLSYRFIKHQQLEFSDNNRDLLPSGPAVLMLLVCHSSLHPSHLYELPCEWMSESFLPWHCRLHPITSLPPSLPPCLSSLPLASPSPLYWASASLVIGCRVGWW